jgi:hypothetical protein
MQLAKDCRVMALEVKMKSAAKAAVATLATGDTNHATRKESVAGHPESADGQQNKEVTMAPEVMQAAMAMQEEEMQAAEEGQIHNNNVALQLQLIAETDAKAADEQSAKYLEDTRQLYQHISRRLDAATANMLLVSHSPFGS